MRTASLVLFFAGIALALASGIVDVVRMKSWRRLWALILSKSQTEKTEIDLKLEMMIVAEDKREEFRFNRLAARMLLGSAALVAVSLLLMIA